MSSAFNCSGDEQIQKIQNVLLLHEQHQLLNELHGSLHKQQIQLLEKQLRIELEQIQKKLDDDEIKIHEHEIKIDELLEKENDVEKEKQIHGQLLDQNAATTQLRQDLTALENQVNELQTEESGHKVTSEQIDAINATVSKLHQDANETEKKITTVEEMAKSNMEAIQRMGNAFQKALDVQKNYEHLQHQLSFTQNQLSLTQQQLLGLQSMMTSSRLWVVSHDQFTTGKEIGRGAWATVHEATFRGTTVAAKCLHDVITSPETKKLFQREMDMALICQHENIITFLGATMEGAPVILMELMDVNLRKAYEQRRILDRQVLGILHHVVKALHFLHTRPDPVIHRDVSSANVLLKVLYNGEWLAKLGDLGTAKIQQQTASAGPGAIAYGAPETGNPDMHSPKMDVYSFGILILETLTRTHPFQKVNILKGQVQQQYPQYYQLVASCTKQQSSDRPTMYDVLVQLDGIAATAK